MFKSSGYSAKNFPGSRRDGRAFQELRQLVAEEKNEPALESTSEQSMQEYISEQDEYHEHHLSLADDDGMAHPKEPPCNDPKAGVRCANNGCKPCYGTQVHSLPKAPVNPATPASI